MEKKFVALLLAITLCLSGCTKAEGVADFMSCHQTALMSCL